jgi:hypothetical protein
MSQEIVKLVPNDTIMNVLRESMRAKHIIESEEISFMIRDKKTKIVFIRGIKIRENCWGLTITK